MPEKKLHQVIQESQIKGSLHRQYLDPWSNCTVIYFLLIRLVSFTISISNMGVLAATQDMQIYAMPPKVLDTAYATLQRFWEIFFLLALLSSFS